ncbi:MAG: FAD:protein FMN transferase [Planctomycetaceae bacterium]
MCLLLLAEPSWADSPATQLRRFEFHRTLMGVPFAATFYASDESSANKAIEAAWARIEHLNSLMSDYDSNSELMRLCRDSRPGQPIRVSPELFRVLSKSVEVSELSDGAFDVSVGPLVKLWRRARRQKELPDSKLLQEARELVGWKNIKLCRSTETDRKEGRSTDSRWQIQDGRWQMADGRCRIFNCHSSCHLPFAICHRPIEENRRCQSRMETVELLKPGMKLDLGGIAVGYAADEAIRVLQQHGITRALIDGSGDIVVSDPPPGATGWRIGIASLREPEAAPQHFAMLANCSISTSGDAYQFVEVGGQRYSHIVDPKTGLGLTERCSVTIIAPDGITADALATAVSVLGPERGLKLIDSQPCAAAMFATLAGERLVTRQSARWKEMLASGAASK